VLEVIASMHFGGAERVVQHLARHLDPDRFSVDVCCTHATGVLSDELAAEGHRVISLAGKAGRWSPYAVPYRLWRLARRGRYDVVHSHSTSVLLDLAALRVATFRPALLHTFHFGNFPHVKHRRYLYGMKCAVPFLTGLVAVAETQRQTIIEHLRVAPERIHTIYNGVEESALSRDPEVREAVRREIGAVERTTVVGCVSVMTEQKGIPYLLQAAKRVLDRSDSVLFVIVGGGRLLEPMKNYAAELEIAERVRFLGMRRDVPRLLAGFDILASASLWEAFAMVLLEGMAAAMPIVATDVGENRHAVVQGETGLVVPPRDADALADAIDALVRSPERATAMGQAGYDRFKSQFTATRMADRHADVYEQLVRTRGVRWASGPHRTGSPPRVSGSIVSG
jgi:glycosyltransferase involved in cell wall biosynthesis